jgi:serine/threonine protein kinase
MNHYPTTPFPSTPPPIVVLAGTCAGSYLLERRIGAGGMGEVWLGQHVVSKGQAAVKLLGPRVSRRADAAALFAREQSALLRLSHPHIVPVFEVGDRHIAMAYIGGASLARRLRAGIAPAVVFRMARQIASALAHAHARAVLHSDVKPSNVLTDAADNAYLADFGAATLLDEAVDVAAEVIGTPTYVAPERVDGGAVGGAADQFSLGRTIVAALLGTEHLPSWGREIEALPASLPAAARAVVARAIAVEPADRFPSMAAFEEALAACDLDGLRPNVGRLDPVRDERPYAWASQPAATTAMAPEITRADYSIESLERVAALPATGLAKFRALTGLRTNGFSLYGHTRSLGGKPSAGWLARARHVVILVPGYLMAREVWSELALALVRDNPDTLVATIDHSGFGDSAFLANPPAREHLTFSALTRMVLAWTELCGIDPFPTVLLGHSIAGMGLFLLPDEAFGPHRARIVLTPMFSRLAARPASGLSRLSQFTRRMVLRLLAVVFVLFPGLYRAYFTRRSKNHPRAGELTPERRELMFEQATRLAPATHMQLGAAVTEAVPARLEPLLRTYFALGKNDVEATPEACERACRILGIRPERFRWFASGGHCPHIENWAHPEGTLRNLRELEQLVDEALGDVSPARRGSTEFAETEPSISSGSASRRTP